MRLLPFLLLITFIGCNQQPHSKNYIYSKKDDHLSLQEKVDVLRKSKSTNDDELLASIALLYAQNNNWSEAKFSISEAIKLNPLDASYHLYLANYNAELGNNIEAYSEAKVAFELGTYDKKLEALIARMAVETLDTINGSGFVVKYFTANKQNFEAQLLMARLHLMQHDYLKAEHLLNQILQKGSLNVKALEVAYKVYSKLDSTMLSIEYGNKLIKLDSTNAVYYHQVAELYSSINKGNKAANYFTKSYQYKAKVNLLNLALKNYAELKMFDSVLFYSDSSFAGINYTNTDLLLNRARAFDKRYKYEDSYLAYAALLKNDSTDSVVIAEQHIVQRKIAYLQRKKREKKNN